MDTDVLSSETYNAIMIPAEKFHSELVSPFVIMADNCQTDDEFLDQAESLIKEWLTDWDLDDVIADVFFESQPKKKDFKEILKTILKKIDKARAIPTEKRTFDL